VRSGPQAVARVLGKRLAPLLVLLAALALVGDPRGGGVQAGLIFATAVAFTVVVGGVAQAVRAFPPAILRNAAVWGVGLAAGAGIFAATGAVFDFTIVEIAGRKASIGGALLNLAAFLAATGVGGIVFLCLAARATPLDDPP
jgi:hypothetical protein